MLEQPRNPHGQDASHQREGHIGQNKQQIAPIVKHDGEQQQNSHGRDSRVKK